MFWLRQFGILLVIALTVMAFSGVQETPYNLWSMGLDFWTRREVLHRDWQTPLAGEAALPSKVRAMLALLRDRRVESYRYSDAIAHDADLSVVQRIAESAYPIRLSPRAQYLLALSSEPMDPTCKVIASRQEVVLASCP